MASIHAALFLTVGVSAHGGIRELASAPGTSAGFDEPTLSDTADVAFHADAYLGTGGVFAAYSGLGSLQPSSPGAVASVLDAGDAFFRLTDGTVMVGNPSDYGNVAQTYAVDASSFPALSEFRFNRHGVYQLANDTAAGGGDVVVQVGAGVPGRPTDFTARFLFGDTPLAETAADGDPGAVTSLSNPVYFGVGQDAAGARGLAVFESEFGFDPVGYRSEQGTNFGFPGNAQFLNFRVADDGTAYYEYDIAEGGSGGSRRIVDFEDFPFYDNPGDTGPPLEHWAASDAGVAVLAGSRIDLTAASGLTSGDFGFGDAAAGGTVQQMGRWVRLDNAGRIATAAVVNNQQVLLAADLAAATPDPGILFTHGQPPPDGDGTINVNVFQNDDSKFHLNHAGQFLYDATLAGTANGRGLFITDGVETVQALRLNQALDPFTTLLDYDLQSGDDLGGRQAFNDFGQVAFKATVAYQPPGTSAQPREAVYVYTPELSFRATAGDGRWGTAENWTLSIPPAAVHDVTIGLGQLVFHDVAQITVGSLTLEGELDLAAGSRLATVDHLTLGSSAFLTVADLVEASEAVIEVGGALSLAGALFPTGLGTAAAGEVYTVFEAAGGITGSFDALWYPLSLDPALDMMLVYEPDRVLLRIFSLSLEGDYNGDGFVSQADLDLVLLNWGASVVPPEWTATDQFDGVLVSQNELDGVLLNWGNGTPPAPASANAIPEPGTVMMLVGLVGVAMRRRRVSSAAA